MKQNSILKLIGNTPVVRIEKTTINNIELWIKLEKQNPGGSIKDRIALAMIQRAEKEGLLTKDSVIVEPTSGNTGIGLAMIAAAKGYKLIIVMPDTMSEERAKTMQAYGALILRSPGQEGMNGAIAKAKEICADTKGWMPMQFSNYSNPEAHYKYTAQEIIEDFPEGLDALVCGVGTGGHISGIAKALKKHWPQLKVYAVEPANSPVISSGLPSPHKIQGIGAGFIPDNLDMHVLDAIIRVQDKDAYTYTRLLAQQNGILAGISTGASLAAIHQSRAELRHKRVLVFAYDTGERYLSTPGLFDDKRDQAIYLRI